MLNDSEKRAARLAVSRYGADRARVEQTVAEVFRARAQGGDTDLLAALVRDRLLTTAQADELRLSLDSTQFDPGSPGEPPPRKRERDVSADSDPWWVSAQAAADGHGPRALGGYRLLRRLGEGGMGEVYLGYREDDDRQVAIKVLSEHLTTNQASVDRFYREAKSGALLNHPNIVGNLAVGQDGATGKHYLVLEYVAGPSAHRLLDRFGRLAVGDAVHIALDVARALEHAHSRNVIHRDIKPDNILLTPSGVAKLSDLGLAKRTDEASHLTATRQGFGTPYYMPYEQAVNARHADGRSDVYALGATLYHLLTGQVPFPGVNSLEILDKKKLGLFPPASSLNAEVPPALDEILERMLAFEPHDRYQTVSEVIVDLERANLAAAVPSFVDPELALQDPVVRQRLVTAAQPTAPDLSVRAEPPPVEKENPDLWYLRYRDRGGQWCKSRATTRQIVRRLRDGRLPREVEASRQAQGDFLPLGGHAEFRAALAALQARARCGENGAAATRETPDALSPAEGVGRVVLAVPYRWWLLVGLGLALATAGGVVLLKVFGTA
jgi:serine/threonine-protein kinase